MERFHRVKLPCSVTIWTSSHGTDRHHFPLSLGSAFNELLPEVEKYMFLPSISAKPGRFSNSDFMREFTNNFNDLPPQPTHLNIILMGDNDIRSLGVDGGWRHYKNALKMIEMTKNSPHALLLMGIMPSPVSYLQTDVHADYCDFRVRKEVEALHKTKDLSGPQKIGFIRTAQFFDDENGFIENELYFKRDRIHLNKAGAKQLATHLLDNAMSFIQVISEF